MNNTIHSMNGTIGTMNETIHSMEDNQNTWSFDWLSGVISSVASIPFAVIANKITASLGIGSTPHENIARYDALDKQLTDMAATLRGQGKEADADKVKEMHERLVADAVGGTKKVEAIQKWDAVGQVNNMLATDRARDIHELQNNIVNEPNLDPQMRIQSEQRITESIASLHQSIVIPDEIELQGVNQPRNLNVNGGINQQIRHEQNDIERQNVARQQNNVEERHAFE